MPPQTRHFEHVTAQRRRWRRQFVRQSARWHVEDVNAARLGRNRQSTLVERIEIKV